MNGNGREKRDIVVAGGSAGALETLKLIASELPADFPAAVFVVLHRPPRERNLLTDFLNRAGPVPACQAVEGEPIRPARIYVPAPDRHLILAENHVHISRGPKEGLQRPSINVTFRSAARSYGKRVIGVLLSGMLDDGASGLWEIARQGGVTIVQDPDEARFPSMPVNALRDAPVDFRVRAAEIAPLLRSLVSGGAVPHQIEALRQSVDAARFSGFSCPECQGPLWEEPGELHEFRCRVGHVFPLKTLISEHTATQERKLYAAILALEEGAELAEYAMDKAGDARRAALRTEAAQLRSHAAGIRKLMEERLTPPVD
ncbi:MAG TPA: chemotaxis protein CheB [Bryobacteraceae bacterium]|jgi:two-component system chemotaxis response regulator CheB